MRTPLECRGWISFLLLAVLIGCAAPPSEEGDTSAADPAAPTNASGPPTFRVDPTWPEPLPNNWILGSVTAVFVDASDHVWIAHLPETLTPEEAAAVQDPPLGTCCVPAPTILELDENGKLVQGWGDPADDISVYPRNPHGLFVDHNDFVWVGTFRHHRVMKFARNGEHVLTVGKYDENGGSDDTELLGGPAGVWVDPEDNEVFISDGYRNHRVIVVDGESGEYLRHWGAYGEPPDDEAAAAAEPDPEGPPSRQFSNVHGLIGSNDDRIYVTDRRNNRIQAFEQSGAFIAERIIAPRTLASGSAFVLALSNDPAQKWLYMADGTNHKVWILERESLEVVGEFGQGGHQLGHFLRPHGMSADSKGNLFVGEASTGRRVQKFLVSGGS